MFRFMVFWGLGLGGFGVSGFGRPPLWNPSRPFDKTVVERLGLQDPGLSKSFAPTRRFRVYVFCLGFGVWGLGFLFRV